MTSEPGSAAMSRTDFVKRLRTARANGDPDKYLAMITVWEAHAIADRLETLTRERDEARQLIAITDCPRPCNDRPRDFTMGQCVSAGECGCGARLVLAAQALADGGAQE